MEVCIALLCVIGCLLAGLLVLGLCKMAEGEDQQLS